MEAKQYMQQYQKALKKIEHLKGKIRVIDDLLTSITLDPSQEKVDHTKTPDMLGDLVAKKCDLLAGLSKAGIEAYETMDDIESTLSTLSEKNREILHLRYIDGRTWQDIADELELTPRYVISLHGKALEELSEKIS